MSVEKSDIYPLYTRQMTKAKEALTPEAMEAWRHFSRTVFKEGALPEKTKQIIAVAVAHVTQCPYCIKSHTKQALKKGASKQELMEAIWIAAEMRAGAATAHAAIAFDTMEKL
ncbi:MAG: carboxymuconolactone decarboxylase family protein [Algicola sp.]|nr:carboxymuconolactone decarboxylase family protein [Algicola sp.]